MPSIFSSRFPRQGLKSFLETLRDLFLEVHDQGTMNEDQAFTRSYQIIGAINYFAISDPTLIRLFGSDHYDRIEALFMKEIDRILDL